MKIISDDDGINAGGGKDSPIVINARGNIYI